MNLTSLDNKILKEIERRFTGKEFTATELSPEVPRAVYRLKRLKQLGYLTARVEWDKNIVTVYYKRR